MNDNGNQSNYDGGGLEENIEDNLLSSLTNFTNIEIVNAQETESVDKMVPVTESRIYAESSIEKIQELKAKKGKWTFPIDFNRLPDQIKIHSQMVNNQEQLNSGLPRFLKQIGKENVIKIINNK